MDKGLLVLVVKYVDCKLIFEIFDEINELVVKVCDGKLILEEMKGVICIISNIGFVGG